ncbi:MAG: PD-(D/E)XK nuclease family protein [Brumimicrobium sp.]|nr:PD-(D/E)XK nuclease family protein [Brumimicrobium sp.]
MPYFIDRVAQFIREENLPLEHLTVVLPSQRAKKYLQRDLFKAFEKPIFSPEIITMNRWIQECVATPVIDPTRALFKLYDIHLKVDKEEPQTLDEFLKWGKILLSDFDEIDRYLIDSKDLFRNLADIKEIENWSFNNEELTTGQKKFMRFWDLLSQYYEEFGKRLGKEGEIYMGKAYKNVASNIDLVFQEDKERQFIFAGFNALSKAEKSIMKQLEKMGRAHIFIDADEYYLKDNNHEAGSFIRELLKELNTSKLPFVVDKLRNDPKEIEVINCTQPTGQAKVSATILREKLTQKDLGSTLLLLADEKMIVPVIKNIPQSVGETNITLGLPLRNTAIRSWTDLLFAVQEHFIQFRTDAIYHKDFIRFIKHPFIAGICSENDLMELRKIEDVILSKNWLFIYKNKLNWTGDIRRITELFFTPWKEVSQSALKIIRAMNAFLFKRLNSNENAIESTILYHFDGSLVKLENILEEFKPELKLNTFKSLFNQHWINETIAYYGNPLEGLQIMGLLETRLIDFENIIVVGLNDGSMPPTNPIQTLIPMDLRKHHELPTPREKQGLFAHHFYRLLHHAKKIWITYSSAHGELGSDEPSRYIYQLKLELNRSNPNISFTEKDYTLTNEDEKSQPLVVTKSEAVKERLDNYFLKGTSASAIRTYLACSLDFYYKYLLGFGEEDEVEEEIEASSFGSFIHEVLEELYKPYSRTDQKGNIVGDGDKFLTTTAVELMLNSYKNLLREGFEKHFEYNKEILYEGKNYLSYEIAGHLTNRFLTIEKNLLKENKGHLFIESLERKIKKELTIQVEGKERTISLKGVIDRIDKVGEETRIIDYKSGKCTPEDVRITGLKKTSSKTELEQLINNIKAKKYVLQLLIYNYLYHHEYGSYPDKTGIVSLIDIENGPFYLENKLTEDTDSLMQLFEEALGQIIAEIYSAESYFEHDPKSKYCSYCE